jgi:hypothetical protein
LDYKHRCWYQGFGVSTCDLLQWRAGPAWQGGRQPTRHNDGMSHPLLLPQHPRTQTRCPSHGGPAEESHHSPSTPRLLRPLVPRAGWAAPGSSGRAAAPAQAPGGGQLRAGAAVAQPKVIWLAPPGGPCSLTMWRSVRNCRQGQGGLRGRQGVPAHGKGWLHGGLPSRGAWVHAARACPHSRCPRSGRQGGCSCSPWSRRP